MRVRPLLVTVCLLTSVVFSGCGRHGAKQGGSDGLASPEARVNAAGESPSWSAVVRPGSLAISIGDAAPQQVRPTLADHGKDGASWSGTVAGNGGTLSLAIAPKSCKDGETGLTYPMTATADVQGRRYVGCATRPGQGLGPRT